MTVPPTVRHMILCRGYAILEDDDAIADIRGLLARVEIDPEIEDTETDYPLCLIAILRSVRHRGIATVKVTFELSEIELFRAAVDIDRIPGSPLDEVLLDFQFDHAWFPYTGLYVFRLWYNEKPIDEQYLVIER